MTLTQITTLKLKTTKTEKNDLIIINNKLENNNI